MNTEIEKIHAKINKLLKLKEGAEKIGSMEEAANAAGQIQKLLFKYNLDLNQIAPEKLKDRIVIIVFEISKRHGFNKTESDWMAILFSILCTHNMCKAIRTNKETMYDEGKSIMSVIGEHHNIEIVTYLFDQLIETIKKCRLAAYKEASEMYDNLRKKAYYRSYCRAFVSQIAIKLKDQEIANRLDYTGGSSLMIVNQEALEKKAKEAFGELTQSTTRKLKNAIGAIHGQRDGKNAQINQGLDPTKNKIN